MNLIRHWSIRVVLLGLLFGLAGCMVEVSNSKSKVDPEEMLQRQLELGVGYLRKGDYARAKDKLTRALLIDPKSAVVHTTFGLLFQLEGEMELAERYFKAAIRYDPDLSQARNNYGAFLFAEKRYHEAVKQLKLATEDRFYVNRPSVFENLGVAYTRIGNIASAEESFNRAIQLNREQRRALLELGQIRFNQGRYVEAQDLYRRHIKLARPSATSLWLCIRVARVFQDIDEVASCELALKNIFPASKEFALYEESLSG